MLMARKYEAGVENSIVWIEDLPPNAVALAGGKGASLGDMARASLPVPPAFVICIDAFDNFLETHGGKAIIHRAVNGLDVHDETQLAAAAAHIHDFILSTAVPKALATAIRTNYERFGSNVAVAVRSSAAAEDSEAASFAGQQESYLNVRGADSVLDSVRACWASFFTARALFYRAQKGSLEDTSIAVVVQKMAMSEKSGVMFTIDPVRNRHDQMMIEAIYGLGEAMVSGQVTPDNYVLDRDSGAMIHENVAIQRIALAPDQQNGGIREVELSPEQGESRVLTDAELSGLHRMALDLEQYFGKPQDVEWCIEGSRLQLLQSRPITTL